MVGLLLFVDQTFSPEAVSDITATKMRAYCAGIFQEAVEGFGIPFPIREMIFPIQIFSAVIRDGFPGAGSICP